jgi:uncharacterized protein YggE
MLIAMLALLLPFAAVGAQGQGNSGSNVITVVGSGQAFGAPDMARVDIGVERVSQDVGEAFETANTTIDAVITALADLGIAREDIRTVSMDIYMQQLGMESENLREYHVANRVNVTVRDIGQIEAVISAAVEAGANNIFGLNFDIADNVSLESRARSAAIEDARTRAEELAALVGVSLGEVVNVSEVQGGGGFPYFQSESMGIGGANDGAVIETGQLRVGLQVQVTYQIIR